MNPVWEEEENSTKMSKFTQARPRLVTICFTSLNRLLVIEENI